MKNKVFTLLFWGIMCSIVVVYVLQTYIPTIKNDFGHLTLTVSFLMLSALFWGGFVVVLATNTASSKTDKYLQDLADASVKYKNILKEVQNIFIFTDKETDITVSVYGNGNLVSVGMIDPKTGHLETAPDIDEVVKIIQKAQRLAGKKQSDKLVGLMEAHPTLKKYIPE